MRVYVATNFDNETKTKTYVYVKKRFILAGMLRRERYMDLIKLIIYGNVKNV